MSFGVGVGDFIAVIKIAKKLRDDFQDAPAQLKDISNEIQMLALLLEAVQCAFSANNLPSQQRANVACLVQGCESVFADATKLIDKNAVIVQTNDGTIKDGLNAQAKRIWKRAKWTPEDIKDIRSRFQSSLGLLGTFLGQVTNVAVTETQKGVATLVEHQVTRDHLATLNWLSESDYRAQHHDIIKAREPGTGKWLLESAEYQTWLREPAQTLFCPGMPGAGKTMLSSIIIDDLNQRFEGDLNVALACVFCNFRRTGEQSADHLLASLVRQAVSGRLPDNFKTSFNKIKAQNKRPTRSDLISALASFSETFDKVFIIIDALDECANDDGTALLEACSELRDLKSFHFMFTSRFSGPAVEFLAHEPSFEIRARDDDVRMFLKGHLGKLPSFVKNSLDLQIEVIEQIVSATKGMFLLARLYLESLRGKRSIKSLRVALQNLTSASDNLKRAYDTSYQGAMERIESQFPEEAELAKDALMWISLAKRPLRGRELQHALSIELGSFDSLDIMAGELEHDEENEPPISDILSLCAGLVVLDEQSDVVRLVHYTTQEYFDRTRHRWFPDADDRMTLACLTYLSYEDRRYMTHLHLHFYAALNWGSHAHNVTIPFPGLESFLKREKAAHQAARVLGIVFGPINQFSSKRVKGLDFAARFGLERLARWCVEFEDPNSFDIRGYTPLHSAANKGHDSVVKILYEAGADLEATHPSWRLTPLHMAATHGRHSIAEFLLDEGASIDTEDYYKQIPLHKAVERGHQSTVQLLIDRGAPLDIRDQEGFTPLRLAITKKHQSILQLLIDKGADVNNQDISNCTPLHYAVENASSNAVIEMLIKHGADIELTDHKGLTPLLKAAAIGNLSLVRLLVYAGANITVRDNLGCSPLDFFHRQGKYVESTYGLRYYSARSRTSENRVEIEALLSPASNNMAC